MAARNEKIRIEVYGPAGKLPQAPTFSPRFDEAVFRLARLIGRQIAREQLERRQAKERRLERKRQTGNAP
jgi:hypothetical protein